MTNRSDNFDRTADTALGDMTDDGQRCGTCSLTRSERLGYTDGCPLNFPSPRCPFIEPWQEGCLSLSKGLAMPATEFEFEPVEIGDGLTANMVWVTGGPIVLIRTHAKSGKTTNSRLDIQKRMFIDALPGVPKQEGIAKLVSQVVSLAFPH